MLYFLLILLVVFFSFSSILFYIYVYPYIMNNISYGKKKCFEGPVIELEKVVFKQAYKMAFSKRNFMSMHEYSDFKTECLRLFYRRNHYQEERFFFPRAFLFYALFEYSIKRNLSNEFKALKGLYDSVFIHQDGSPGFKVDRIDQVVFGLISLVLYNQTKEDKYRENAKFFFDYLLSNADEAGIVVYRRVTGLQHVDVLGMIIPFLMEYSKLFSEAQAEKIAFENLSYYIKYGLDEHTGLPFHAFDLKTKYKQGPMNWGRGLVWFYLGLLFIKEDASDIEHKNIVTNLITKIESYLSAVDFPYSQFIGLRHSPVGFDSSVFASLAFIRRRIFSIDIDYSEIIKRITSDGMVLSTSGDTLGINNYARVTSPSEFTQAMLLLSFI